MQDKYFRWNKIYEITVCDSSNTWRTYKNLCKSLIKNINEQIFDQAFQKRVYTRSIQIKGTQLYLDIKKFKLKLQ